MGLIHEYNIMCKFGVDVDIGSMLNSNNIKEKSQPKVQHLKGHSPTLSALLVQLLGEPSLDEALNTLRHANLSHSTLEAITPAQWGGPGQVSASIVAEPGFCFSKDSPLTHFPSFSETWPRWAVAEVQSAGGWGFLLFSGLRVYLDPRFVYGLHTHNSADSSSN